MKAKELSQSRENIATMAILSPFRKKKTIDLETEAPGLRVVNILQICEQAYKFINAQICEVNMQKVRRFSVSAISWIFYTLQFFVSISDSVLSLCTLQPNFGCDIQTWKTG